MECQENNITVATDKKNSKMWKKLECQEDSRAGVVLPARPCGGLHQTTAGPAIMQSQSSSWYWLSNYFTFVMLFVVVLYFVICWLEAILVSQSSHTHVCVSLCIFMSVCPSVCMSLCFCVSVLHCNSAMQVCVAIGPAVSRGTIDESLESRTTLCLLFSWYFACIKYHHSIATSTWLWMGSAKVVPLVLLLFVHALSTLHYRRVYHCACAKNLHCGRGN